MSLAYLIRGKTDPELSATAIHATCATQTKGADRTVASVASVAVARPANPNSALIPATSLWWRLHFTDSDALEVICSPEASHAEMLERYPLAIAAEPFEPTIRPTFVPMSVDEESAIRTWLALIEETDMATISGVIERCQQDADARAYFAGRAASVGPAADPFPDDRRSCRQCANLSQQGRCMAAWRDEIAASRSYTPIRDLPRRCECYILGADKLDTRHGQNISH